MRLDFQTVVNVEKEEESESKVEPEEPTTTGIPTELIPHAPDCKTVREVAPPDYVNAS
jgi:hypothetical protein